MSSHHMVKEGQEPALIIANGQMCSYALLEQMLEWSPFVIVCDGAYERVRKLQIKADVVIGDFDSIPTYDPELDVQYVKLEEQETTDLEKAINWLKENDMHSANIIWGTGMRLDHTVNNLSILAKYRDMELVIYDDHSKAFLLPPEFKKQYGSGDILSLIPMGKVSGIQTENLKYPIKDESLELGKRSGTSNEVLETGMVKISHKEGGLILLESRDEFH